MKKYFKIIMPIMLIVILSINSFAAIVSDNDGSAFVTKSEFDALKKSFNKQIDDYNNSIDRKIDGAIASYLAGIKISTPPNNLYDKVKTAVGGDLWMKNYVPTTQRGSGTIKNQFTLNVVRRLYYAYYNNLVSGWKIQTAIYGKNYTSSANYKGVACIFVENNFKALENTSTDNNYVFMCQGYKAILKPGTATGEIALNLKFPTTWAKANKAQIAPDATKNLQVDTYVNNKGNLY